MEEGPGCEHRHWQVQDSKYFVLFCVKFLLSCVFLLIYLSDIVSDSVFF